MPNAPYPTRDIWNMFPTTKWLVEVRPDHMEADAAYFDQASQGTVLGQGFMPAAQLPVSQPAANGQGQVIPVGQTTNWEIEEKPEYMKAAAIEWGGIRVPPFGMRGAFLGQVRVRGLGQAPDCSAYENALRNAQSDLDSAGADLANLNSQIQAATDQDTVDSLYQKLDPLQSAWDSARTRYDQVNASYLACLSSGIGTGVSSMMQGSKHFQGAPAMLGQVPLRMGQYDFAPLSEQEVASNQSYAMVNPLTLAYSTGAYIQPGAPGYGRFARMPQGLLSVVGAY